MAEQQREFRVYTVSKEGPFIAADRLTASDDAQAVELTKSMLDKHPLELWEGSRFIVRIEPEEQ